MDSQKIVVNNKEEYDAKIMNNPELCKIHHESGNCRGEPECSLTHLQLENSSTIMIKNLFCHPILNHEMLQIQSHDLRGIGEKGEQSFQEKSFRRDFEEFYDDLIVKLRAAGSILMFKCCVNSVERLRGNVYVCYEDHECASRAVTMFNGFRKNSRKNMEVALSPVVDWEVAVCNEYVVKGKCGSSGNSGKICTRLHVMSNPRDEYKDNRGCNQMTYPQIYLNVAKKMPISQIKGDSSITQEATNSIDLASNEKESFDVKSRLIKISGNWDATTTTKCKFYANLGCCNKGPSCRNRHKSPPPDTTQIIIHNFFDHPYFDQRQEEGSELVTNRKNNVEVAYAEFYRDAVETFTVLGEIVTFICCRNTALHLRGNVYIQYADRCAATKAVDALDRSVYDGRKLRVEFIPLINWRSAACRFHVTGRKCLYGGNKCPFVHVFRNPGNKYALPPTDSLDFFKNQRTPLCKSYYRSGICLFESWCQQGHVVTKQSTLVLVPNLFKHPKLTKHSSVCGDITEAYETFYCNFIAKFRQVGPVLFWKCLRDRADHLRGNVYVQYPSHAQALNAVKMLKSEGVDSARLCYQINWGDVFCNGKCRVTGSEGDGICNLLHAFRNPHNEYDIPFTKDGNLNIPNDNCSSFVGETARHDCRKTNEGSQKSESVESDGLKSNNDRIIDGQQKVSNSESDGLKSNNDRIIDGQQKDENSESDGLKSDLDRRIDGQQKVESSESGRNDGQQKCESVESGGPKNDTERGIRDCERKRDKDRRRLPDDRKKDGMDNRRIRDNEGKRDDDRSRGDTKSKQRSKDSERKRNDKRRSDDVSKRGNSSCRKRRHSRSSSAEQHRKHVEDDLECTGKDLEHSDKHLEHDDDSYYLVKVTRLPRKLDVEEVLKLFCAYEGIKSVDIPRHRSGSRKEFSASLVFGNKSLADKVLNVTHMVDGQPVGLEGYYM